MGWFATFPRTPNRDHIGRVRGLHVEDHKGLPLCAHLPWEQPQVWALVLAHCLVEQRLAQVQGLAQDLAQGLAQDLWSFHQYLFLSPGPSYRCICPGSRSGHPNIGCHCYRSRRHIQPKGQGELRPKAHIHTMWLFFSCVHSLSKDMLSKHQPSQP